MNHYVIQLDSAEDYTCNDSLTSPKPAHKATLWYEFYDRWDDLVVSIQVCEVHKHDVPALADLVIEANQV